MYKDLMAVAVFCFNRADYLQRLCDSLEAQSFMTNTHWYFFHDVARTNFSGRLASEPERVEATLAVSDAFPDGEKKEVHRRTVNAGVGIQQYEAYEMLRANYRYVTYLDDDVVLSPDFLRVSRLLITEMMGRDDVVTATAGFVRHCNAEDLLTQLGAYEYGHHSWIGYTMDMERWTRVLPTFLKYYKLMEQRDYMMRHPGIRLLHRQHGWERPHTSQDAWKDASMNYVGAKKLRMIVNRGFYIGESGVHGSPGLYQQQGWEQWQPYEHETDKRLDTLVFSEEPTGNKFSNY